MASRWRDPLQIAAAVVLLIAGGVTALALLQPIATSPIATVGATDQPDADAAAAARPPRPGPLASYGETLARPLFEPTRRPVAVKPLETTQPAVVAPVPKVAPAAPPVSFAGLKLLGVVKTGAEPIRALVRAGDGETGQWVTVGAQLGRWRIETISDGAVVLEAQGTRVELAMFAAPRVLAKR